MDPRSEIKMRLPIEELVGQYCQLTRKGRNFVCLCPFHSDTHPSFVVSPDKGIGYCFACQSGGDIFSFYQKIENVDFPTALRDLAEKVGVELPKESSHASGPKKEHKERVRECLESALHLYMTQLKTSDVARSYLAERGVDAAHSERFEIGYAPDSYSATYDHLLKDGFSQREVIDAGLAIQKDLDGRAYDRFRHRIMFPIRDHQGHIVGFGGRALKQDDAKYVNSPEGVLYHKSSVLYGLSLAKEAVRSRKQVLLVEGYFDVVAAHKAGIEHVAAVSGTALTPEHAKLLARYAETAILCLDQDKAGQDASARAFHALVKEGVQVHAVDLPAKDPDELVQKDAPLFAQLVSDGGVPYLDAVIESWAVDSAIGSPQGKRRAVEALAPLLNSLPAAVEREAYMEKAALRLGMTLGAFQQDVERARRMASSSSGVEKKRETKAESSPFGRIELCVGLGLLYPEHRATLRDLIPPDEEEWTHVLTHVAEAGSTDGNEVIRDMDVSDAFREKLQVLLLFCEEHFADWSESLARRELRKICSLANKETVLRKQKDIIEKLKIARQNGRMDEESQLLTQYRQSLKLLKMAG